MPYSMTGMGRARAKGGGAVVEVELRSVNNRYFQAKCRLPEALQRLEPRLVERVRRRVHRGTVELAVKLAREPGRSAYRLDRAVLAGYVEALRRVRRAAGLDEAVVPELLAGLPEVVQARETAGVTPAVRAVVEDALERALDRLVRMRAVEGRRLARGMVRRRRLLERILNTVEREARGKTRERMERLQARAEELLGGRGIDPDDPGLLRELAFLADRADVTEEVERFRSHLLQFDRIVANEGEVGRALDFLLQEMGREVNTLGAKAASAEISHHVVRMKAELEKIREQVQNIE